jgi:hypothetical protein
MKPEAASCPKDVETAKIRYRHATLGRKPETVKEKKRASADHLGNQAFPDEVVVRCCRNTTFLEPFQAKITTVWNYQWLRTVGNWPPVGKCLRSTCSNRNAANRR